MKGFSRDESRYCYPFGRMIAMLLMGLSIACGGATTSDLPTYYGEDYVGDQGGVATVNTINGTIELAYQVMMVEGEPHAIAEGDMDLGVLTESQMLGTSAMEFSIGRSNEADLLDTFLDIDTDRTWPGGIIPYDFILVSPSIALEILYLRLYIEEHTPIRFVRRDPSNPAHDDYLLFASADYDFGITFAAGLYSDVKYACKGTLGRLSGRQLFVLSDTVCSRHSILHELGHSLGLLHEHTRPDRDDYIEINEDAMEQIVGDNPETPEVETSYANPYIARQFFAQSSDGYEAIGDYDFESIMHWDYDKYRETPLSGRTIIAKPEYEAIYRHQHLSNFEFRQPGYPHGIYEELSSDPNSSWTGNKSYPRLSQGDLDTINYIYLAQTGIEYAPYYSYVKEVLTQKDHSIHYNDVEEYLGYNNEHEVVFTAQRQWNKYSTAIPIYSMKNDSGPCFDTAYIGHTSIEVEGYDDNVELMEALGWSLLPEEDENHILFYADTRKTPQNPIPVYAYISFDLLDPGASYCDVALSTILNDPKYMNDGYVMSEPHPSEETEEKRFAQFYVHSAPE